jgi:hypothetical protein
MIKVATNLAMTMMLTVKTTERTRSWP